MYYSISGTLVFKDESAAAVRTGGVTYEILIPRSAASALPEPGGEAVLFTKMIVREDDTFLVGFLTVEDRRLFETLLSVSGIGPKQALKILSEMPAAEIRNAVVSGNESALARVKGVGAKTASRIILELKDKIQKLAISGAVLPAGSPEKKRMEVLLAMRVLGYGDAEAKKAVDSAFQTPGASDKPVEDLVKTALSAISR